MHFDSTYYAMGWLLNVLSQQVHVNCFESVNHLLNCKFTKSCPML